MNKLIFAFALSISIVACKKETSSPNTQNNGSNSADTTTNSNSSVLINNLDCSTKTITGTLKKGENASAVSFSIKYIGGDGKNYSAQTINSTGISGLTAKLNAGNLNNGDGVLNYAVTGAPTTDGKANFAINVGGKSCSITLDVAASTQNPQTGYGPDIKDIEGNTYKTVSIGGQVWMAENLKVKKYNDGSTIPNVTENTTWQNTLSGAWCEVNNTPPTNTKYGKLYNWYIIDKVTNGNKNVCPTVWHVPDTNEWNTLFDNLGGFFIAGGNLKETGTTNWSSPNTGATNISLFTALPGGMRQYTGAFVEFGKQGFWWSSTPIVDIYGTKRSHYVNLYESNGAALTLNYDYRGAMSIRCIKD
jgi:uncharacterized protein (TIGR02145 family)